MKRAAILGCGSGGMAMAVDLGMRGFRVSIFDFPEYDGNLRVIEERGSIEAIGSLEGEVEPDVITTDMAEAVEGADAIFLAIRAYGVERFVGEVAKVMEPRARLGLEDRVVGDGAEVVAGVLVGVEIRRPCPGAGLLGLEKLLRVLC